MEEHHENMLSPFNLAADEARRFKHKYVGSEHLLIGLIRTETSFAAQVLTKKGATLEGSRYQLEQIVGYGANEPTGVIPFTPLCESILENATVEIAGPFEESERLLLAICRGGNGVGPRILELLKVTLQELERDLLIAAGLTAPEAESTARKSHINRLQANILQMEKLIIYGHEHGNTRFVQKFQKDKELMEEELNSILRDPIET